MSRNSLRKAEQEASDLRTDKIRLESDVKAASERATLLERQLESAETRFRDALAYQQRAAEAAGSPRAAGAGGSAAKEAGAGAGAGSEEVALMSSRLVTLESENASLQKQLQELKVRARLLSPLILSVSTGLARARALNLLPSTTACHVQNLKDSIVLSSTCYAAHSASRTSMSVMDVSKTSEDELCKRPCTLCPVIRMAFYVGPSMYGDAVRKHSTHDLSLGLEWCMLVMRPSITLSGWHVSDALEPVGGQGLANDCSGCEVALALSLQRLSRPRNDIS